MKTLIVFMGLCLLLVGCSSSRKYWTKENYDPDQYRKDDFFCQQQGRFGAYKSDGIWYAISMNEIYKQCMYSLGYFVAEEKKKGVETEVMGTGWKAAFTTEDGQMFFYNTETISRPSPNIIRVWVKAIFNKKGVDEWVKIGGEKYKNLDYSITLHEYDCSERKMRILSTNSYSKDKKIIESLNFDKSDWTVIIPERGIESLYKTVCK